MNKQEEIREGLIYMVRAIHMWAKNTTDPLSPEDDADDILKYLVEQGVVLMVGDNYTNGFEPLIKEDNGK